MAKNYFDTDFGEERYTITIVVLKGGNRTHVQVAEGKESPTLQDVIGAIEYGKYCIISDQMNHNKEILSEKPIEP